MIDRLINDFSGSIKAKKIKNIIGDLRNHHPGLIFSKPYNREAEETLVSADLAELFQPEPVKNENCAKAVVSGLLIWNDCENEAHKIAQNISTPEGSYFHAIIHRREPDMLNSNYWFRKTGDHPVFSLVYDYVTQYAPENIQQYLLTQNGWNPELFNELVEKTQNTGQPIERDLMNIQHAELLYLIAHSYRHTIGS